jgi:high-affinity nickel permease
MAMANLVILLGAWRHVRQVRRGGSLDEGALDAMLAGRGLVARLFRPLFRAITGQLAVALQIKDRPSRCPGSAPNGRKPS